MSKTTIDLPFTPADVRSGAARQPRGPGWWFAKWRIADDGTENGDELTPSDEIECVQVVINQIDEDNPEHLRVSVNGVARSQSIENFYWIDPITMPKAAS